MERNKSNEPIRQQEEQNIQKPKERHSSAFKETKQGEEKSTINPEEADLEQERKEARRERD